MKMNEDETISDFYTSLSDISNKALCLGEHFSKVKLV